VQPLPLSMHSVAMSTIVMIRSDRGQIQGCMPVPTLSVDKGQTLAFSCAFIYTPNALPIQLVQGRPRIVQMCIVYMQWTHIAVLIFVFAFAFAFVFVFAFASLCVTVYMSMPLHHFLYIFSCLSVPITLYLPLCLFMFRVPYIS